MNYLKTLIEKAEKSGLSIELSAASTGINVVLRKVKGRDEIIHKSTAFWIDRNETDMEGRMNRFINAINADV